MLRSDEIKLRHELLAAQRERDDLRVERDDVVAQLNGALRILDHLFKKVVHAREERSLV